MRNYFDHLRTRRDSVRWQLPALTRGLFAVLEEHPDHVIVMDDMPNLVAEKS